MRAIFCGLAWSFLKRSCSFSFTNASGSSRNFRPRSYSRFELSLWLFNKIKQYFLIYPKKHLRIQWSIKSVLIILQVRCKVFVNFLARQIRLAIELLFVVQKTDWSFGGEVGEKKEKNRLVSSSRPLPLHCVFLYCATRGRRNEAAYEYIYVCVCRVVCVTEVTQKPLSATWALSVVINFI